jgi:hypothetical protein
MALPVTTVPRYTATQQARLYFARRRRRIATVLARIGQYAAGQTSSGAGCYTLVGDDLWITLNAGVTSGAFTLTGSNQASAGPVNFARADVPTLLQYVPDNGQPPVLT